MLSRAEVQGFYDIYLEKAGQKQAASLQPWLVTMRRLTWLRTTLFMARWRVQTRSPRDPMDPTQWSDAGRIDYGFRRDAIAAIRSEWMA
jgi:hypothetical protein